MTDKTTADALADVPVLVGLPDTVRELVVASFVPQSYEPGEQIVRQGDDPDGFYVVVSGSAKVVRDDNGFETELGTFGPGDSFGETGLLDNVPRSATVRATEPVEALRLEPALFRAIAARHPEVRARLEAQARARRIEPLLTGHPVFSVVQRDALVDLAMKLEDAQFAAGSYVIREGDPPGPMYVVASGRLRAQRNADGDLRYLRAGDVFGEVSMYTGEPRSASIEAVSDVALLVVTEPVFRELEAAYPEVRERIREQMLFYAQGPARGVPLDFVEEMVPAEASQAAISAKEDGLVEAAAPAPTGAPARTVRGLRLRRPRRVRHIRQLDEVDCGAACLAMLCRHFGHPVALSFVREAVGSSIDGTSMRGIQRGADAVGLDLEPVKVDSERLDDLALPAIVHWQDEHWLVVDDVRADRVHVADPANSSHWLSRAEFLDSWTGFAVTAAPNERLHETPTDQPDIRWLRPLVRPHRRVFGVIAVLALVSAVMQMLVPVVTGRIIDKVIDSGDYNQLYLLTGGLFVLQLVALLTWAWNARLISRVAVDVDAASLDHVASRLLRLPLRWFETRRTGDIEARLDGMRMVREFVVQQGAIALTSTAQLVVAVALMLIESPILGLVWLGTIPVYWLLTRFSKRHLRPAYAELQEGFGRYRARRIDAIKGIETVKSLGREEALRSWMVREFEELEPRVTRADLTAIDYGGAVSFVTYTLLVFFLFAGSLEVMTGHLSIGELVAFNSLALLASGPLLLLLDLVDGWQLSAVLLARLRDVLDQEPEGKAGTPLRSVPSIEGRMTLRGVGFRYPATPDVPILDGVTLDIRPGSTVAFVGRSGSGKSTLLKCLAGLLEPTEGVIELDGVDLRELDGVSLRRFIGTVPQEPYVFDGTIAENIALGEAAPDLAAVRAAAEIADAHDFVERLPLGYRTRVGEGGMRLSGGQAQRVAIARAIYHRPPVVLLDEATSALDSEAERTVTGSLRRLLEGRTAFVVAQRLSTVRDATLIVVLDRGRIAESGTHDELLARGGLYTHLYGQQLIG